jgi:putative ABC transport system permease protein
LVGAGVASLAGVLTYVVTQTLDLRLVLASIIVNIGLFSVNLSIMGRPNLNIVGHPGIIEQWHSFLHLSDHSQIATIVLLFGIVLVVAVLVALLLLTEIGLALRASGMNKAMARALGVSPGLMLLLSLALGNLLTGLSGALVAEQQGFADVSMGIGTIIYGVTAVLLGEVVVRARGPVAGVATVLVGAIAYRLILAFAFRVGVPPEYFRGLTSVTVLAAVLLNTVLTKGLVRSRRPVVEGTPERSPIEKEPGSGAQVGGRSARE